MIERRLPVIELINDDVLRQRVTDIAAENVPDYFWEAPAASSYAHHNPYCCSERGLWVHTLMVYTAYERLVDSYVEQELISDFEADIGRAAVILHDMRKYDDSHWDGKSADWNHDIIMADIIRNYNVDERVADAVASHMGPWYNGPSPETPLQRLVHNADMMGATKNGTLGIYKKPDEITELYPSIPEADL